MEIDAVCIPLKRFRKLLLFGAIITLFMGTVSFAQPRTITGTVTSSDNNLPLPGVNVLVQGTATGALTDLEGKYTIEIPDGDATLQFSFIGFNTESIEVGSSNVVDVVMTQGLSAIDEVVITSLGISREKKRITYSAQNVETDNLARARELNVMNSLQGKVAGLDLIRTSSGVGSASRTIIRGNRSIAGNNQPLYIVDGVPISNVSWSVPSTDNGGVQGGDGISNLNPDDIAGITVLKGPNAVALYGARAANGAVVITTRKGSAGKGIEVEFNTNASIDRALLLTKFQHIYGQGNGGVYNKNSVEGWGPKMEGQMVDHWTNNPNFKGPAQYAYSPHHNFEEFFQTGYNLANTLTLTSGSDKIRTLFSYTNNLAQGIVETNKLKRNNFHLRIDGNTGKRFSYDAKLTYFNQHVDNRLATGDDFNNPMRYIYKQPSNISLDQAREFEFFDEAGTRYQHYWRPYWNGGGNVYWHLNRTIRDEDRNRILGMGSLRYQFTDNLSLMVRSSFDQIFENEEYKQYNDTYTIAVQGNYHLRDSYSLETNNDFLLTFSGSVGELLSIDASLGGNLFYQKVEDIYTRTNRLLKPDLFTISNTSQILSNQGDWKKKVNSLYGFATIGIKDFLFIDVTGRNDWSSTLPRDAWSYFYPSAGLTWLLTDMLDNTPRFLTFFKLRASYAEVGNDTNPYIINQQYIFYAGGQLGYVTKQAVLPAEDLLPENTKSTELGFDIRLFRNRVGFDFTWYRSNTFNQLLSVPIPTPSGYSSKFINAGNMQNSGVELVLNLTPVAAGDFSWNILANYAKNNSLCVELTEDLNEYTTSGFSWMTTHKIVVGEPFDQIYTRGFLRNEEGRIWINNLGLPLASTGQTMPMGHSNPDWTGGFTNTLNWRGLTMSVLLDARWGGDVFSLTEANLTFDGFSEATLEGRDGFVVDGVMVTDGSENAIETTAEAYWHAVGGRSPIGEPYRYDASFVRVREVLLGYSWNIPSSIFRNIGLSLYARNLGFLYNASGIIDPGMSMTVGNHQGSEGFGLPSSRTFGMNARFKF